MPPTEKPALQSLQEKVSEAGISVLELTMDSFRLLFKGDQILTRVRGSILPSIAAPVVLFAVYSSFFAAIRSTGILPSLGGSVISLMSMAIGLLVSFRTSTAYDRWWACRGLWASISSTSRTMMLNLWLNVRDTNTSTEIDEDKITVMKLIVAYSLALKNHCRRKPGLHHADLAEYLPPSFVESFDGNSPKIPPLEVIKLLHQYVIMFEKTDKVDPRSAGSLLAGINTFTNELSNAERILTPWPLAYSIHLKQIITLYCLALPPQLASALGWWVVPVTCAAVFTFFGMEAIALEISDPFGYDLNDLPIDKYCNELKTEMLDMMATTYRPSMQRPNVNDLRKF
ncbi:hypothetical protein K450DRAFT_235256 [Umbelopsis ramanniana AG]|uniref:Uncharacterized protein n=1 Tax=Umbelopsis ramanniana AG TaxID=1314678 RepID=A0AAD5HE56_UMBRA|nr:uncharacterized protein K450DRAFT_235256 [Umbelopsis ramanniana AG]KAI8580922.1 hypothetical protein K450DRAFT_235256 [Umbelopsis ramanniana AG]